MYSPSRPEPIGAGSIFGQNGTASTPERRHTEPRYVRLGRHPESVTLQVVCRVYPLTVYSPVSCSVLTFQAAYHASTKRSVRGGSVSAMSMIAPCTITFAGLLRPCSAVPPTLFPTAIFFRSHQTEVCVLGEPVNTFRSRLRIAPLREWTEAPQEASTVPRLPLYSCAACWPRWGRAR